MKGSVHTIDTCSLTSSNYKSADVAVFVHHTGMSIIQELTPYPHGYFPGSSQATNCWLMYGSLGGTGFSLSR